MKMFLRAAALALSFIGSVFADTIGAGGISGISTSVRIPAGVVVDYAGSSAPAGWVMCNGQAISRTAYPSLYAAIGTTYGVGDGSTTFNVPDARGRQTIGAGTGSGLTARTLAATGGGETHVLTTAQMPQHSHGVTDPGHTHTVQIPNIGYSPEIASVVNNGMGTSTNSSIQSVGSINDSATTGISIQNNGSGSSHPIMDPFIVFNKIIKQ